MAIISVSTVLWLGLSTVVVKRMDINLRLMRFFRDVSRSKARRRLYGGNDHALMSMVLGREEMLFNKTEDEMKRLMEGAFTMTREELAWYDGGEDENGEVMPLYISVSGRVYDVTEGGDFYGEDGKYHCFVATDATRAFATGCLQEECLVSSTAGLKEKELKEVDRWIELYETHDKYKFVGFLVDDPVEALLQDDEEEYIESK